MAIKGRPCSLYNGAGSDMKKFAIKPKEFWKVLTTTSRSQSATMVLKPGQSTGTEDNRHTDSDQWLYVIAGEGSAVVGGKRLRLKPHTLLLIEAGEYHEIKSGRASSLRTLNIYAPPTY